MMENTAMLLAPLGRILLLGDAPLHFLRRVGVFLDGDYPYCFIEEGHLRSPDFNCSRIFSCGGL
jgi:hypothetical protein